MGDWGETSIAEAAVEDDFEPILKSGIANLGFSGCGLPAFSEISKLLSGARLVVAATRFQSLRSSGVTFRAISRRGQFCKSLFDWQKHNHTARVLDRASFQACVIAGSIKNVGALGALYR